MPSSTAAHPVLFLPVPDPSSFHLLMHWVYFGDMTHIVECLDAGVIQWEGIARNVEYLGLPTDIKVFLGKWYGAWLHPEGARARYPSAEREADLSDDDDDSDSDDDDEYYDSYDEFNDDASSVTSADADMDVDDDDNDGRKCQMEVEDEQPSRGRTRTVRCLSWTGPDRLHPERDERRSTWSGPAVLYEADDEPMPA